MRFVIKKKIVFLTIAFALLALDGCRQEAATGHRLAPDFALRSLSGEPFSLAEFKGKVVLVDFWATWCPPCRKSIPELVDLQKKYLDTGLVVLGISMDHPDHANDSALRAFKDRYRINYRIARANGEMAMNYFGTGEMAIPTMFVVSREGRIVAKHVGYRPGELEKSLKEVL